MSSQQSKGRVHRKRPQTNSADSGGSQGIRNRTDLAGYKVKKISTAAQPCSLQTNRMNTSATTTDTVEEKPSKLGRATEPGGGGGSPPRKQPHLATTTTVSESDQHQQQPVRKNLIQKLIEIDRLSDLIKRELRIRSTEASAAERLRQIEFVSPDYLGADLEHVEVMQRKFDEFLKELKSHESRVLQTTETGQRLLGMLVPPPICTRYNWPKSVLLPGICPGVSRTTEDEGSVIYIEVANNFLNQAGTIVHLGQWDGMAIDAMMTAHTMVKNWLLQEDPSNKKLLKTALSMNIVGPVHLHAGPSAALPMALAIASWATNRRVRNRRVFTGRVSLVAGWITAVGGIAQKTAAARACGYSRLVGSRQNEADFQAIPAYQRSNIEYRSVQFFDEVVNEHLNSHPLEE